MRDAGAIRLERDSMEQLGTEPIGGSGCLESSTATPEPQPLEHLPAEVPCSLNSSGAVDHLRRCLAQPDPATAAPRISLEAEVPEALFEGMRAFLRSRPEWDQYRVITSALAGFLFQNGCSDRSVSQHYLNGLFMQPEE